MRVIRRACVVFVAIPILFSPALNLGREFLNVRRFKPCEEASAILSWPMGKATTITVMTYGLDAGWISENRISNH